MKEFLKKNLQVGIPKGLQNDFKRGFKVFVGNKTLSKSIKEEVSEVDFSRWHTPSFQLKNLQKNHTQKF